jgi:hypothetical protein
MIPVALEPYNQEKYLHWKRFVASGTNFFSLVETGSPAGNIDADLDIDLRVMRAAWATAPINEKSLDDGFPFPL